MTEESVLAVGRRIVVHTPDRRQYRGILVEFRRGQGKRELAVVRLDTGWVTSYPTSMVHPLDEPDHAFSAGKG